MAPITPQFVRDFYDARLSGDPDRIAAFLDDDVRWSISGPVDPLQFCGDRRGKQAVLDTLAYGATLLQLTGVELDESLIDGERAATFMRVIGLHKRSGRTVSYRCAHFLRVRDGRIVEFRALIDSFDAAEQVLGHAINTALIDPPMDFAESGNRVAL
jgi:ketosteroid isomerase-like protein